MMDNESQKIPLQRICEDQTHIQSEFIVQESIISLYYRDENEKFYPYATLLGTPTKINELHAGHLLCEGLVPDVPSNANFEYEIVDGKVHSYYSSRIQNIPEHRIVTTSCGACNHPDLSVNQIHSKMDIHVKQWTHIHLLEALNKMQAVQKNL